MTKRETALGYARIAGYHGDQRQFTRLLVESRVRRQAMNEAWAAGVKQRQAGVPCGCHDCRKTEEAS